MNIYEYFKSLSLDEMATISFFAFQSDTPQGGKRILLLGYDGQCYDTAESVIEANKAFLQKPYKAGQIQPDVATVIKSLEDLSEQIKS